MRRAAGLRVLALLFIAVVIAACTVRFVSSYDEVFDQRVTELQKKVDVYFANAEQGTNGDIGQFMADAKADVAVLTARANAIEKNNLTIEQVGLLKDTLEKAEALQRAAPEQFKNSAKVQGDTLDTIFRAIITLELAKKRE